jgi:hypothetical protein
MPDSLAMPARVRDLAMQFAQPQPMRRGSLSERFVKCSKPGCPCADDPKARHGPYFSLTRGVGGRTQSRLVSDAQAELVRRQVQAGQQFRQQVEALWKACEEWADAQLQGETATAVAQKRGSKRPWKAKSAKRSKHS